MKSTNSRIQRLKTMMSLEEKRIALQEQLDAIQGQMTELRDQLFSEEAKPFTAIAAAKQPAQRKGAPQRTSRGALKERIVAALQAAGRSGIRVKELAEALNTKPVNVHSWFHSATKRYPAIKKISGGHYRLEGKLDSSTSEAKAEAAPKAGKAQAPRTRAKSTTRGAKGGASPSRRGELSARILSEMEDAGSEGINVRELAEKLGANYKNIYIWFATTGKKNPNIVKLGKAQYRLES